jgi:hypothetical protein
MAGLRAAAALTILALSSGTGAQTPDPRQSALDDFVAARMLTTKCPSWQLDVAQVRNRFSSLDLKPEDWQDGGPYARFFDDRLSYYSRVLSRMSERRACDAAEAAFGPSGQVRRGWMRRQ